MSNVIYFRELIEEYTAILDDYVANPSDEVPTKTYGRLLKLTEWLEKDVADKEVGDDKSE